MRPSSTPVPFDILVITKTDGLHDVCAMSPRGQWTAFRTDVSESSARAIALIHREPGGEIWTRLEAEPDTAVRHY